MLEHEGVSGVYWGWQDSRYSGARRGIWASGVLGAIMGCKGCQTCIGGLAGILGTQGPEGV